MPSDATTVQEKLLDAKATLIPPFNEHTPGLRQFPLFSGRNRGALYVPHLMTQADFELITRQIEHAMEIVEELYIREWEKLTPVVNT